MRVAIAHYNGVTLWFPNALQSTPERLEWKGSHVSVAFSPSGGLLAVANYLVNTVSVFAVNPTTGALTAVACR